MSKSQSLLLTWMITALVAVGGWFLLPGSGVDRWCFERMAHVIADPPLEVSGGGSRTEPWILASNHSDMKTDAHCAIINLEDDPGGIFQEFPHAPIDVAVILTNLKRLGTQRLACSVVLAWENPDAIGLTAMENALEPFDSVVLATPVTRGAIMEALPSSMRRASLELAQVRGDIGTLPQVNRISIPSLIHGGENTWTGFQVIDSEPEGTAMPLMARWDDRIIFAFPVVAAMQQLDIEPKDLVVVMGSHLQFGKDGPRVAIDEFGRLAEKLEERRTFKPIAAETLIDAEPGNPAMTTLGTAILRDLRSNADLNAQQYNRLLPTCILRLQQGSEAAEPRTYSRLHVALELLILLGLAVGLAFGSLGGRGLHSLICILAIALAGGGLWLALQGGIWLVPSTIILTILVSWVCGLIFGRKRRHTTSMPRLDRLEFASMEEES